jgi:leucyl/phenylalanyl-tRNA--protein transferase
MFFQLTSKLIFPNPELAEEDGLLAIGGDLSLERLVLAYRNGIFPWYSEDDPILWYSPHQRFVLKPDEIRISHTMQQLIKSNRYQIKWNTDFEGVLKNCSAIKRKDQPGTWLHPEMIQAYIRLHKKNIAQSVEVWQDENLVGGLYGVVVNKVFCGESMFSKLPNTSKLALIALCQSAKFNLIDCQVHTRHLESMGATYISRTEFIKILNTA